MGDALTAVWQRLDSTRPVFMQDDAADGLNGGRDELLSLGVLREVAPSLYARCPGCAGGLLLRAESLPNARTGGAELRLPCPACGPVSIHADCLRRWSVDVRRLLGLVAAAAGVRCTLAELVEGHLWYVGAATWLGRSHQVYFARFVHGHPRAAVLAGLSPRPRSVLLHPTEHALSIWGVTTPNPAVALESVVKLGPDGLAFDAGVMESCLADAGFGMPKPKPPRKRSDRAGKIEQLTREMLEHLRSSCAHAHALLELNRPPALLERPSQQQLAGRCELSETDVSRCLHDEAARELKYYWELALDLDRVMAFKGRITLGPND